MLIERLRKDEMREVMRNQLSSLQVLPVISKQVAAEARATAQKSVAFVGLSFEQQELIKLQWVHEKEMHDLELKIENFKLEEVMKQREMDFGSARFLSGIDLGTEVEVMKITINKRSKVINTGYAPFISEEFVSLLGRHEKILCITS